MTTTLRTPTTNKQLTVHGDMTLADLTALALDVLATLDGAAYTTAVLRLADIRDSRCDAGRKMALINFLIDHLDTEGR